jgi:hypothetical protein
MEKYIEQVKNGWTFLNGRKKSEKLPVQMIFIAGVLQAISCWVIAEFFTYFFASKVQIASSTITSHVSVGVALVTSLAIIGFTIWADRGKNLGSISWFGEFAGKWQDEYYEPSNISRHYNIVLLNALTLCKVLCLMALINAGQTFWIIYAFTFAYASFIAAAPKTGTLQAKDHSDIELYTWCGAFALLSCIFHPHLVPVIIATALAYIIHRLAIKLSIKKLEMVNDEINRTLSEVILCTTLIIGILFIK